VEDKRLLVIEGEFGGALRIAKRDGSSLSSTLRSAWDGVTISPLVSGRSRAVVSASDPHFCLVAHVTQAELHEVLSSVDLFNGVANRFLWGCVRRGRKMPFPEPMPEQDVDDIGRQLAEALRFAHDGGEVSLSPEARHVWGEMYGQITSDEPGALGAVTARVEAHALRLALTLSLLERSPQIEKRHLVQTMGILDYCHDSATYLFGAMGADKTSEQVLGIIQGAGTTGLSQTGIRIALSGHIKAERLVMILAELQTSGRITQTTTKTSGRPVTIWRAKHG